MSIDSLLREATTTMPERPALVAGDLELSYADLTATVDRLADRMVRALGSGRPAAQLAGLRIGIVAPNAPALVAGMFAVSRLGAVAVPLSARLRERELRQILSDAEPALILAVAEHHGYPIGDLLRRLLPALPTLHALLLLSPAAEVEDEVRGEPGAAADPLGPEIGAILYTSGTTGTPKGALVTHEREAAGARTLASVLHLDPHDRVLFVIPVSHAFGLTCFLAAVAAGACAILVDSTFSPAPLLNVLRGPGASVLHGSPSLFRSLLRAEPASLAGVRAGFVAGAAPPPGMIQELDDAGPRVLNLYGLTETGAVSSCRLEDTSTIRHETAGRALPGYTLRVGAPTAGGLGELEISGPYVTPGYHRREAETAASRTDGWFRTGDLATLVDGAVRITGRAKDVVHVGGFNVFPAEVEAALLAHPDVHQAAVVGVPSERMGEALHAFVVPRTGSELTPQALLRFARAEIAGYKLPYAIDLLPELPLLASGKTDRRALTRTATDGAI
jgi:long-chain acyl-CoA synthetase